MNERAAASSSRFRRLALAGLAFAIGASGAQGADIRVGPGRQVKTLKAGIGRAKAGDVVLVDAGTYREAMKLRGKGKPGAPITIRGVPDTGGKRPVIDGTGVNVNGRRSIPRALFQVEGDRYVIENLEFKNARNGNNGAGIRFNGSHHTIVRNCKITYCDMGIQGGDKEYSLIESCEIAYNGTKEYNGYSHNFYLYGKHTVIRYCYIHHALFGQNVKTRGHHTELWYNWISDSEQGEIGPVDSKETASANSNFLMVGNVVVSKPNRKGNRSKYVDFGMDSRGKHNGTAFIFNNTFIAGNPKIVFIRLSTPDAKGVVSNNIFYGSPWIIGSKGGGLRGRNNWVMSGAKVPSELTGTIRGTDPGFIDLANRKFRLKPNAPALNRGIGSALLTYLDGDGNRHPCAPDKHVVFPLKFEPRPSDGTLDLGAFEWGKVVEVAEGGGESGSGAKRVVSPKRAAPPPKRKADPKAMAREREKLIAFAIEQVKAGRKPRVYVDFFGKPTRVKLTGASSGGFTADVMGTSTAFAWKDLTPARFCGVVRRCLDKTNARHQLGLARYCAVAVLDEQLIKVLEALQAIDPKLAAEARGFAAK